MDENLAAKIHITLGEITGTLEMIKEAYKEHQVSDAREFAEIRKNFERQDERLSRFESIADTVEIHGEILAEMEKQMTAHESKVKVEVATKERDRVWIRWIFMLLLALTADHFSGSKLAGWLSTVIK